jgi:hypothetical protein
MTKIRLDHHDQKEPTTTEQVYRHLFAAVRAAHSGHAFAVLEHYDKAMTLEATELALAISIYDLRAVAMDAFALRDAEKPLTMQQIRAWMRDIEHSLLVTPDKYRDNLASQLLPGLNRAIKQSGRDFSIDPQQVLQTVRGYESAPQAASGETSPC